MTDVKTIGRRPGRRGIPLRLEQDVFQLIAAGHDDLQHDDGKPNLSRIAREAGIDKQRLSEPLANPWTLGALVRCYARLHGITDKQALAVLLRVDDEANAA